MATKKSTQDLLTASNKVLNLARAQQKKRMAKQGRKVAATKAAPAKKASAPAKKAPIKKVKAADAEMKPNSGNGHEMDPTGDVSDSLGTPNLGVAVPPDQQAQVEQGAADGAAHDADNAFPGISVPPELADSIMAVTDPADLPTDGEVRFDMVPFAPEATTTAEILQAGAHWVLFANGEPVAKIQLKGQENEAKIAGHFVTADFARSVIDGIQKHGLDATLKAIRAKPYVAVLDSNKKAQDIQAKLSASSEETFRSKVQELQASYTEHLGLVLTAGANNFYVQNPLKDGLISAMANLGIDEETAAALVDDQCFRHMEKTVAGYLDKAREMSTMSPTAFNEIKAAIEGVGRRSRPLPSTMGAAHTNPNYDSSLAQRMSAAAVPATPAFDSSKVSASVQPGSHQPSNGLSKEEFRNRFGGFSR